VHDDPRLRHSGEWSLLLEARGRLKLLRGDATGALADFRLSRERGTHVELPTVLPWRSSAALAHHALGDRDAALDLLAEELALAERCGVDRALSTALRVRGIVLGGDEGLGSLQAAVDVLGDDLPRLERTHALVDLGAALRHAGQRREAEPPLRAALAAAETGGATVVADRARAELSALGTRVRRSGAADQDVLTPAERRVAELASAGKTNRDIAQELFITPKTVEYHLRYAYRKLGIQRRTELPEVLARP
jgi:DNA-binding CsgD family transcriptional regulator